jgi:hypothetical protein
MCSGCARPQSGPGREWPPVADCGLRSHSDETFLNRPKKAAQLGGHVDHAQAINGFSRLFGDKGQEQHERVAVTAVGVGRQVALADQLLQQETSDPGSQQRGFNYPWATSPA